MSKVLLPRIALLKHFDKIFIGRNTLHCVNVLSNDNDKYMKSKWNKEPTKSHIVSNTNALINVYELDS